MSAFQKVMRAGEIVLAVWGVAASIRHLGKVITKNRTSEIRSKYYIDAGDLPPEKIADVISEAYRAQDKKRRK